MQTHRIIGIRCRGIRGAILADLVLTLATSSRDLLGAERFPAYPAVIPAACLNAGFRLSGTSDPINFVKIQTFIRHSNFSEHISIHYHVIIAHRTFIKKYYYAEKYKIQ